MFGKTRKAVLGVAALAALALGGAALSDAATSGSGSSATPQQQAGRPAGPHVGANGRQEQALTGDTAAKVKAAAEEKLPGGTVERVETDVDTGSPYEAHVRKSDGSDVVVYVNKSFEVTSVASMQHP